MGDKTRARIYLKLDTSFSGNDKLHAVITHFRPEIRVWIKRTLTMAYPLVLALTGGTRQAVNRAIVEASISFDNLMQLARDSCDLSVPDEEVFSAPEDEADYASCSDQDEDEDFQPEPLQQQNEDFEDGF